jgi:protein-S-isoprenylcysteine O-methyltransferase Ste14
MIQNGRIITAGDKTMKRTLVLTYGIINYALGAGGLVALIAFIFNLVPGYASGFPVDANIDAAQTSSIWLAIAINLGLISLFAVQHSVMARPAFKQWLTRSMPKAAERSTYMLATAIVTFTLILGWQPIPDVIWQAENPLVHNSLLAIGLGGWALVFYATFLINHFDLFGLRQVWLYFTGREYSHLPFKLTGLYKYVRHPIMTGVFIGLWFTPVMTLGHLVLACGLSAYILIGVYHEEKDLVQNFGQRYRKYQAMTGRFIPVFKHGNKNGGSDNHVITSR